MEAMKKILTILLVSLTITAFSQSGSQSVSGIKYRVNDTTAYQAAGVTAHAQGYADIYWNNQATVPHFDIWNGSSYDHVFDFNSGSGGGLTPPIDATDIADGSVNDTEFQYINTLSSNAQDQFNAKANEALTHNTQTGTSYTLVLTDADTKLVEMNNAGANTLTVPLNATVAFPIGTQIPVAQYGAGLTTIAATGGVTINTSSGSLDSPGQYAVMVLEKRGTNEWYLWNGTAGGVSTTSFVDMETPSGTINSSNTVFTIANTPISGSVHVYLNGLLQKSGGSDYSISGTTITFVTAPETGSTLLTSYRK